MQNTKMMLTSQKDSAERRLRSHVEDFGHRLLQLQKALDARNPVDAGFLQHCASFAEDAATYNSLRTALEMINAEIEIDEGEKS